MTPRATRAAGSAAAILAAAALLVALTLPEKRLSLSPPSWHPATTIATGAFHIHTIRSDGTGTPDEIAAAAARAGLDFLVFTDHGDGTRLPDPPQYRSGVLCLDGVEISTTGGHYVATGLPRTPYPLGGDARDVVEDVARFGGFGVAAHPESAKPELRWREWTAPFDGLEWLNADSEWRDEPLSRLGRALMSYPIRAAESVGTLLDRPSTGFPRWDAVTRRRRVVALAGADAHARLGFTDTDPYRRGWFLRLPSYQVSFQTFALRAALERPFQGDARRDATTLLDALRGGHVYTGIDALASPAALEFSGTSGRFSAQQGDELPIDGPVRLLVRVNAPARAAIVLRRDGQSVRETPASELQFDAAAGQAVFRVEVLLGGAPGNPPVPWIVSNPIYVVPQGWKPALSAQRPPAREAYELQTAGWHVEHEATSRATIDPQDTGARRIALRYELGSGEPAGQFAAVAFPADPELARYSRLTFRGQASRPMRLSVQIRLPRSKQGERWQRSAFLDEQPRLVTVFFDEMTPIGSTSTWRPDLSHAEALLFVVDTTNTLPGARGTFTLDGLRLER